MFLDLNNLLVTEGAGRRGGSADLRLVLLLHNTTTSRTNRSVAENVTPTDIPMADAKSSSSGLFMSTKKNIELVLLELGIQDCFMPWPRSNMDLLLLIYSSL